MIPSPEIPLEEQASHEQVSRESRSSTVAHLLAGTALGRSFLLARKRIGTFWREVLRAFGEIFENVFRRVLKTDFSGIFGEILKEFFVKYCCMVKADGGEKILN